MKKFLIAVLMIFTLALTFACTTPSESASDGESKESAPTSIESVSESETAVTHVVSFVQDGYDVIEVTVEDGKGIPAEDLPSPRPVVGHDVEWDVTDFSNVTGDMTVTAIETPKQYVITYELVVDGATVENLTQTVTYGEAFVLEVAVADGYVFKGWKLNGEDFVSGDAYLIAEGITLVAVWDVDVTSDSGLTGRY